MVADMRLAVELKVFWDTTPTVGNIWKTQEDKTYVFTRKI
jgi:hypothetical protein